LFSYPTDDIMKTQPSKFIFPLLFGLLPFFLSGLNPPTLSAPSDGSKFQVLGTNLFWNAVSGATYYKLKIATDPQMTNVVFTDNNVVGTSRFTSSLAYNTTYYWTVQAANATSQSLASATWSLTTMPDNPNAVTTHPRLLFTKDDLPRLRSWAVSSNPVFNSLKTALNTAISNYNTKFFPGGQPNPVWPDNGGITWSGYVTESYAEFFAFWSLIDPDPNSRILHAQRARNLLMVVIDSAYQGPSTGLRFRDPGFMTYDRSRVYGEACPLTVDWIYNATDLSGNPILTPADKAKINQVFRRWCHEQLTAYNHPEPIGVINDRQLLPYRWALNNYYSGHARNMTYMSIAMDAADDPVSDASLPYSALGNCLRSYLFNAMGAWLYQQYAMYEKPEIVTADYGLPANFAGIGLGSGGFPVEGSLYGESIGWVESELLALKTSGWADENIIGKQARFLQSDYWTRFMDGLLFGIVPDPKVFSQETWLGSVYPMACYGDLLRTWSTPEFIDATGPLGVLDIALGANPVRLNKARWYARDVIEGGANKLDYRITNIWAGSTASYGIYYFMLLDPTVSLPTDPRPTLPGTFWDPAFHRVLSRTNWTSNATLFDWHCHWTSINHQSGDGNQFELFRKGEWLIKERSGYADDGAGYTSEFHNTIALQNDVPANLQFFETQTSARGGQWTNGVNAGDPTVITSIQDKFIYATGDATNLYNRPNIWTPADNCTDILYAVRSIVWLKPDHVVVYDRAKSKTANRFKRFFLQFTAPPIIAGKKATVSTPGGQNIFVSNLLPAASVLTTAPSENFNQVGELDPTTDEIRIEDPSNPTDVRFLNVIQGADGNVAADPVTLLQSSSGNAFDGVILNHQAILFPNLWGAPFSSTIYTVPVNVTSQMITGLTPLAGYTAVLVNASNGVQVTITPGGPLQADAGGVLILGPVTATHDPGKPEFIAELFQNRPNPATGTTAIGFSLSAPGAVSMRVYDLSGREVSVIFNRETYGAGYHEVNFNMEGLAAGMYFYELQVGDFRAVKKITVFK
jgi:hypothetical protein